MVDLREKPTSTVSCGVFYSIQGAVRPAVLSVNHSLQRGGKSYRLTGKLPPASRFPSPSAPSPSSTISVTISPQSVALCWVSRRGGSPPPQTARGNSTSRYGLSGAVLLSFLNPQTGLWRTCVCMCVCVCVFFLGNAARLPQYSQPVESQPLA